MKKPSFLFFPIYSDLLYSTLCTVSIVCVIQCCTLCTVNVVCSIQYCTLYAVSVVCSVVHCILLVLCVWYCILYTTV